MFPAVRFKALDYVFESNTSVKMMLNLLALPIPYVPGSSDLYPHSGKLPEVTYRTPWVRADVISTCKHFIDGSALEDLQRKNQPLDLLERFSLMDDMEVIPSSNPDSFVDFERDELLFNEFRSNDPCEEMFLKLTTEQIKPQNISTDLLLPEKLLTTDHLPRCMRRLPSLGAELSALTRLDVSDSPLSPTGSLCDEDVLFRCFEFYELPADEENADSEIHEKFVKELLGKEESLLLPAIMDAHRLTSENCSASSSIYGCANVSPELLEEQLPVLDDLQQGTLSNASVDISQFDVQEGVDEDGTTNGDLMESDLAEPMMLPDEMELDLTLSSSPKKRPTETCLSASELQEEEQSPLRRLYLVSARAKKEMTKAVWRAEKYPTFVVRFLLSEPQTDEPAVDFQPLCEALNSEGLSEEQSFLSASDQPESGIPREFVCGHHEFIESLRSECPLTGGGERREVFSKLPLQQSEDSSIQLSPADKTSLRKDETENTSQVDTNIQEVKPSVASCTKDKASEEKSAGAGFRSPPDVINKGESCGKTERRTFVSVQASSFRPNVRDDHRGLPFINPPPAKGLDPLSTFMMLRSQQLAPATPTPEKSAKTPEGSQQTPPSQLLPPKEELQTPQTAPGYLAIVSSGSSTREQNPAPQITTSQTKPQEGRDSMVVQVPASDSQRRAYCELLAFALPILSSARLQGLNYWTQGDFSSLCPSQTHFLLKQQERALLRAPEQSTDTITQLEALFNQAAVIHVLVTFKDLLLKCNLATALEYLTNSCADQSLEPLQKKMQIVFYLSHKKPEPDIKLERLQRVAAERLHSGTGPDVAEKILVIVSADCDDSRSTIVSGLKQATGAAVAAIRCEDGKKKLNGASVVSSVRDSVCVVVYEQHVGPDFPWSSFSLVVEYDRPGHSPWAAVCREKSVSHLSFNTSVSATERSSWCLQENIPYVLFVTEGLLNCPQLLQILESNFNITVVERTHSPTLQMLGGIQYYAVITVDESTAIFIQEQEELSREQASDGLMMRLTALSLQYNCCWFILHCPDSQGEGLSSEAFNHLVLVYSALVLFSMKSEDLDVKVLIVSDVLEISEWVNQICFLGLMSSHRDPLSYLNRDWLSVMPSQDEESLSQFPCVNPLVGQLMLRRAPSLQWLLDAPLSTLKELLPEVPRKVLQLFSDTTSLYSVTGDPETPQPILSPAPTDPWNLNHLQTSPRPEALTNDHNAGFLLAAAGNILDPTPASDVRLDLSSLFGSPRRSLQRSWTSSDPWQEVKEGEEALPGWRSKAGATVGRAKEAQGSYLRSPESPFKLESAFRYSHTSTRPTPYSQLLPPNATGGLAIGTPAEVTWGQGLSSSGGTTAASGNYGGRCLRSGEAFGSAEPSAKRSRLSYERVPGRSDGQTRLTLF